MGKQYYCEYCDRSFKDSGVNRKNHFKGAIHQRQKRAHYDSFRDAARILADEATKLPCKRFLSGSGCDYGDSCRFSHMTPDRQAKLERQAAIERAQAESKNIEATHEPKLEEWLEKYRRKHKPQEEQAETAQVQFTLPPFLMNVPNLPPSLLPPSHEEFQAGSQSEWG